MEEPARSLIVFLSVAAIPFAITATINVIRMTCKEEWIVHMHRPDSVGSSKITVRVRAKKWSYPAEVAAIAEKENPGCIAIVRYTYKI